MVEKTQKLIEHINHHHLRLSLTTNIGENLAVIKMYDNYATVISQLLHVTISNLWDLENQLWRLWIEVNGAIHYFIPHLEDHPPIRGYTYCRFLNHDTSWNYCIYIYIYLYIYVYIYTHILYIYI